MPAAVRLAVHGVALVAGAAVGVVGSFIHPLTRAGLPVGLLVALALSAAVPAAAGLTVRSRSGAGLVALGWLVAVVTMSLPRSEGDLVVPATALGYSWLLGGTLVAGLTLTWPYSLLPRPTEAREAATGQVASRR